METKNFDAFNRIALHLLVELFEVFPGYLNVEAEELGIEATPGENREELHNSVEIAMNTVTWLDREGFISVGNTVYGGNFLQVRLTLKGLTLLGYDGPIPKSGGEKYRNLAEQAKDVLADGGKGAATEIIKELFIRGLKYLPSALINQAGL